jgi:acyl dehydratase
MKESKELYYEDLEVGQTFHSGTYEMTAEKIKAFAAEWDPQPFHLDEEKAKDSLFQGLAASGWHTAAATMRLMVDSDLKLAGGSIGAGGEELRWPRPTRPGDVLKLEIEILEKRESRSRADLGIVKTRLTTTNQREEVVQVSRPTLMVRRRGAQ